MTNEEKQFLFRDLCVRLPYGVRVKLNGRREKSNKLTIDWLYAYSRHIEDIKPYLRPMSSMTDMEKQQFNLLSMNRIVPDGFGKNIQMFSLKCIDWFNSHHFDYRGLIEMGLALEAPEGMYNLNE